MAITRTIAPTTTVTTWTHLQGDDEFCWLFGLTSSIHRTLLIKSGIWGQLIFLCLSWIVMTKTLIKESLTDRTMRKDALKFLKKKTFHQTLRHEILFAVAPRTLKPDLTQQNGVYSVMSALRFKGFLREEGFKQLGTIIEMTNLFGHELQFNFTKTPIDEFCRSRKFLINFKISYYILF